MRLLKSASNLAFSLSCVIFLVCVNSATAQEKPASPDQSNASSSGRPLPSKKPPARVEPDEQDSSTPQASASDADGPEAIRNRAEWFYKQRSSVGGHIPAGARLKAFQHMQQMMVREGKLIQRPDGSYAEVAPKSWLSPLGAVTSPWTSIGPTPTTGGFFSPVTGRVMTIAVDPSDAAGNTVLLGGAMGGIWRTTDGGTTWTAIGDQNASLSMGSIAFAPSNSSIVYAGTGEQALAFDTYYGAGVLKSSDHGQTWTQTCTTPSATCPFIGPYTDGSELGPGFGFLNFGGAHISYVAVNPSNSSMVLVGAEFISEGPKEGVYCSDNGGATWSQVLADETATFVGFASSTVAYAAFGTIFGSSQGVPNGNGIYKATSIGSTCSTIQFSRLTAATLPPQSTMGRIDLGIAPSVTSGSTVYASIADSTTGSATNLGVFVTTNGGTSWTQTSAPDICQHQCWYDNVIKVDPNNQSIAFFGGSAVRDSSGNFSWVIRTTNSGANWASVIPNLPSGSAALPHVDNHAMAFFKATSGTFAGKVRMYLGNDGGIWRTDDAEASSIAWVNLNNPSLTLTQFYPSISIHGSAPSIAFGGTQDNGSQNYQGGTSWVDNQLCGDGASTATDFIVTSTVYIGCATGAPVNVSYQDGALGTFAPAINGINLTDASSFIPPLATDPNAANVLYFGTTRLYQSTDAGNSWAPLSTNLTGGSNGVWLNAIAVAPGNSNVVYAGNNAGGVYFATNVMTGGTGPLFFNQVNQNALPPRAVTSIAIDPADPTNKTVYVAFSAFSFVGTDLFGNSINDPLGHIFKTSDGGSTWTDISCSTSNCSNPAATDLPNIPVNDLVVDPDLPGTLYAATDLGVFVTSCSAAPCTWSTLSTGLPRAAVLSLRLHEPSRTLRAATHGRGAWDINLNNFSFTGPHISSLSPVSIGVGAASLTLTINGSGLTNGSVQWNGSVTGVTTTQVSDTQLTASVAASLMNLAGTSKITVLNGTQTSNAITFSILAATPTLTSINPPNTPVQTTPSTAVTIQLTGTNFSASAKVLFNGAQSGITVAAPTTSCPLPTCLNATLPAALLGPFGSTNSISVLNLPPGGGQSKPLNFQVVAPPPPNDNFANAINITTLTFNDLQDSSGATTETTDPVPPCVTQSSPTQGNTGGHPNGAYNTIWYKFTPAFSANLSSMDTTSSNYDTVLSIWTGSAGSLTNVACNDDINPGIVIQSSLFGIPLTAGTTYYIMVSSFGPPDPNPIALGGRSQLGFQYNFGFNPTPAITSLSPTSANSGDPGFTLIVNGSGFLPGATVFFSYSPAVLGISEVTTFVSSNQLSAVISASDFALPGSYVVCVQNPQPNAGCSNYFNFKVNVGTYPVPTLTSISPNTAVATTPGLNMSANGGNFAPTAVLNFNGVPVTTAVSNPSTLFAVIPPSLLSLANVGTVQVSVSNPTPGGGPSAPQPFLITQPTIVPTLTSVSPPSIPASTPTTITVTGTGFVQGVALFITNYGYIYPGPNFTSTQFSLSVSIGNPGVYAVYVVDPAPGGSSGPFNLSVTGPPDFSLTTSGTTSMAVNAGQTATFSNAITISALNGFNSQVTLSCAPPASLTTCNVNPNSFASGSGTATVTVTTTKSGLLPPSGPIGRFYLRPQIVPLLVLVVLLALLMQSMARTRRQRLASALPLAILVLFFVLQAIGCGGGNSAPPPPPPPGTPAGTYTVTVTGTASTSNGTLTHTSTVTLTVN